MDLGRRFKPGGRYFNAGIVVVVIGLALLSAGVVNARLGGSAAPATGTIQLQKGLLGWWKFNGNTRDATPYGRNGTAAGSPVQTVDRRGAATSAYSLGGGDYIDAGASPISGSSAFTMSAWINTTQVTGYSGAFAIGPSAGGSSAYIGTVNTAQSGTSYSIGGGFYGFNIGSGVAVTNQWVHVAMTYDGSTARMYVNGNLTNTVNYTPTLAAGNLRIGRIGTDTIYDFSGRVDDVRLYNRALSAAEAGALYATYDGGVHVGTGQKDMVGWWKLDGNAYDGTPYASNGTLFGGVTPVSDRKGIASRAYSFNGSTGYVSLGNSANEQVSTGTVSAWVKASSPGSSYRGIVVKQYAYSLFLIDGVLGFYDWTLSTPRSTGIQLGDGVWHHVALSFDSGIINGTTVYIDGSAVLTTTLTIANHDKGLVLGAGNDIGSLQHLNGSIDDVRLYKRVLTAAEVSNQYASYGSQIRLNAPVQ